MLTILLEYFHIRYDWQSLLQYIYTRNLITFSFSFYSPIHHQSTTEQLLILPMWFVNKLKILLFLILSQFYLSFNLLLLASSLLRLPLSLSVQLFIMLHDLGKVIIPNCAHYEQMKDNSSILPLQPILRKYLYSSRKHSSNCP